MHARRLILAFFARLILIYAIFIVPWPGLDTAYLWCFRAGGDAIFGSFGKSGTVSFEKAPTGVDHWTTVLTLQDKGTGAWGKVSYRTRTAYLATVLTLSLILATPLPGRRRAGSVAIGFALACLFVTFRLWLGLLDGFSAPGQLDIFQFSLTTRRIIRFLTNLLLHSPESTFVVPVFIWIVATLRTGDLKRLAASIDVRATESLDSTTRPSVPPHHENRKKRRKRSAG